MAAGILFADSFDHYASSQLPTKWSSGGGSIVSGGREGNCFQSSGYGAILTKTLNTNYTKLIIGAAVYWNALANGATMFTFLDTGNYLATVGVNALGGVQMYTGYNHGSVGGSLGAPSQNNVFTTQGWYYAEALLDFVDNTAQVKVNGLTVLNLSGQNLSINGHANQIGLWGAFEGSPLWDDLYLVDATVGAFLGDVLVTPMFVTGNGRLTNFAPSPSSNFNWQNVDDQAPDGDSSYNSSANVGDTDCYAFSGIANAQQILGVQLCIDARKDSAGTRIIECGLGNGTTEAYGPQVSLPNSYNMILQQYPLNPITNAPWTPSDLATLQAAVKIAA